jgi:2'-5' RNA ligase
MDRAARTSHSPEEIRSFIAIELPEEVRRGLAALRSELQRDEHRFVKWVDPYGIHLTLKFLGNIHAGRVTEVTGAMEGAARGIRSFPVQSSGLGVFPSIKQVRVFWVGIGGQMDRLSGLQRNIDSALADLGFAREERPFVPHLTLARVRQGASPSDRRSFGALVDSAVFEHEYGVEVKAVSLMKSQLTPAGAVYSRLSVAQLGR